MQSMRLCRWRGAELRRGFLKFSSMIARCDLPQVHTLFAAFCFLAAHATAAPAHAEMIYRRGAAGDVATPDPQKTGSVTEADILGDLFEGLVTYDSEGRSVPGVAESWTISDDGLTYTF